MGFWVSSDLKFPNNSRIHPSPRIATSHGECRDFGSDQPHFICKKVIATTYPNSVVVPTV